MEAIISSTRQRHVFIDADACPVIDVTIRISNIRGFPVVLAGNETQNLERFAGLEGVTLLTTPVGRDSADFAVVAKVSAHDIVVTDDIGLASIVLARGARVLNSRGIEYSTATIDFQLLLRHESQKIRRSGGRTKGPLAYSAEDKDRFIDALKEILKSPQKGGTEANTKKER